MQKKPSADGYAACGIYIANNDIVDVQNSTINAENGVGIVVRGGKVSIDENTIINATGSGTGMVGDSKEALAFGKQIIIDRKSNYPAMNTISITAPGKDIVEL